MLVFTLFVLANPNPHNMKSSALLAAGLAFAPAALADWPEAVGKSLRFSTVTGYFLQDETDTNPSGFDYVSREMQDETFAGHATDNEHNQAKVNFGLLDRDYPTDKRFDADGDKTQWQRFQRWVDYLNSRCHNDGSAQYKLFFLGRHGEGWHNAAESFYGTPNWNVSDDSRPITMIQD